MLRNAWPAIGVVLALAMLTPYPALGRTPEEPEPSSPDPSAAATDVWHFISEPDLMPMRVTVNTARPNTVPGPVFLSPLASSGTTVGQTGSLIVDNLGNPIWFRPLPTTDRVAMDFRVQKYRGRPVLTTWEGRISLTTTGFIPPGGPISGYFLVFDQHYREIARIDAKHGWTPDFHELLITPDNTFMFIVAKPVEVDLTPYGGPADGCVMNHGVQEIDPKTGKLIFEWDMMDHVPLSDSMAPVSTSPSICWDAYHMNSISLFGNGGSPLLIGARNTWAIYKVSHKTGDILWTLSTGVSSDFAVDSDAKFYWQHDAQVRGNNRISMFDDGCCGLQPPEPPNQPESSGLILQLDFDTMTASLVNRFVHSPSLLAPSQGNVQKLPHGHEFIGWGQESYYSEFTRDGTMIYDAQMPGTNNSYRVYRSDWTGMPMYSPSIAVRRGRAGQVAVYASWNGSTETASWELLAGPSRRGLSVVRRVPRDGFETSIGISSKKGPFFQVRALGPGGQVLGTSKVARLGSP